MINGTFRRSSCDIFEFPCILSLIVQQVGKVVSFVKIFEHRRQDLGLLFRKVDAFGIRFDKLATAGSFEERRLAEDLFMTSKETLFRTNADGDDRRCKCA